MICEYPCFFFNFVLYRKYLESFSLLIIAHPVIEVLINDKLKLGSLVQEHVDL